jgi:hypothetical protein
MMALGVVVFYSPLYVKTGIASELLFLVEKIANT